MASARGVARTARASVLHGVLGQGVLAALPVVLLARLVRAVRAGREDGHQPDRTPGVATHTSGEAAGVVEEKARGNRKMHRRSRRVTGPPEMVIPMCTHRPACPSADAPDRDAAKVVVTHPDQGWSLLCNGVVLFDDLGQILPNGRVRTSGAQQVPLLRRYGSRRHRSLPNAA
ncbi:MAG TPA: DUF5999 family protein [Mycobacteriales bacterium]|nr:DUF5999 family protein [Mycobacteriales bacterium]